MKRLVTAIALVVLADPLQAQASSAPALMAGIRSLQVNAAIAAGCRGLFNDSASAQVNAELAIRRLGIEVNRSASTMLEISAVCSSTAHRTDIVDSTFTVVIRAELREPVLPVRVGSVSYWASTWESSWWIFSVSQSTPGRGSRLENGIARVTDMFENEWLSANPRRRTFER